MGQGIVGTSLVRLGSWLEGTRRRPLVGYPVAVGTFLLALLARFELEGVLPPAGFPFLTFFPAVIVSAFVGGLLPGLLCSAVSILAAWYFFVPPAGSLEVRTVADGIALAFFTGILVLDCLVIHVMNGALERNAVLAAELSGREAATRQERDELWRLVPDLLMTGTLDGRFLTLNPAWRDVLGYREEDLRARPFWELVHPDTLHLSAAAVEAMRKGETARHTNRVQAADGTWRWFDWVSTPVGEVFYAVARDVTAEREREASLRETQARLAHAQRMEALGQLAGGIAHDFNNVMQAVTGGAGLIRRRKGDAAAVDHLARMVEEAAGRGASITRRLLSFARRGELRAEAVDPTALLADLHEMLDHTLGAGIAVRVGDGVTPVPAVAADKGQLETVLVNLAANARDAMPDGGVLTLFAEETRVEEARPASLARGHYVRFAVADTGLGMSPEVLARVTEPFFTTKERGKGTGLGLAMARGFAEQSGGALAIHSTPGAGTTVSLWLPVASGVSVEAAAAGIARGDTGGHVLVVEDEPLVREVIAGGLEERGYRVTRAPDAAAALAVLGADDGVDLLLTDYVMPGMDGLALVREARRRRPGLTVLLLTGNVGDTVEEASLTLEGVAGGSFGILRKPVRADELAERVAGLLDLGTEQEPRSAS